MRYHRFLHVLALLAAVFLIAQDGGAQPPPAQAGTAQGDLQGDVNCSGAVDSVDSLQILRVVAGLASSAGCLDAAGDTDCSGGINSVDSLRILRFVAALSVSAPDSCAPIGGPLAVQTFLLNEIRFLPEGGGAQFVELKNVGVEAASPSGLTLVNETGGTYVLPEGTEDVPPAGVAVFTLAPGFLDSESGFVQLKAGAVELDHVAWGSEQPASVRLSRGGLAGDLVPGTTIGRIPGSTTRAASDWVAFFPSEATPGAPNPHPGVTMLMPLNGALFSSADIPLTWYTIAGAEAYRVQVSTEETFAAPEIDETVETASFEAVGLAPGEYSWRVQAIAEGGVATESSPVHRFTVDLSQTSASITGQAANLLDVPLFTQHKDTPMLLMESVLADGDHAWDVPHPTYNPGDPADNANCALAAIAMVNAWFGGDLSQDRIGFHITEGLMVTRVEHALYWGRGTHLVEITRGLTFAIGSAQLTLRSGISKENWDLVTAAIDSKIPLIGGVALLSDERQWSHAVVIDGYFEKDGQQYVDVNDPSFPRSYAVEFIAVNFQAFWEPDPEIDIHARSDEPGIWTDGDGDGMADFDELVRFKSDPAKADTDGDLVGDKEEVRETVFDPTFGYSRGEGLRERDDWDGDELHKELDCDADNDGQVDGLDADDFSTPPVRGSPVSCSLGGTWGGEAHTTLVFGSGDQAQTRTIDATGVVFAPLESCLPGQRECFETVGGMVHFTISGYAAPGCTAEGELTAAVPRGNARLVLFDNTYVASGGYFDASIPAKMTCGTDTTDVLFQTTQWLTVVQYAWPDRNVIEGEYNMGSFHTNWRFERVAN